MDGFRKTRVMNALLLVLIPVLVIKTIVSLVGPNLDWPFVPVIVLVLATSGISYSALGKSEPRRTIIAVYLNWVCMVVAGAAVVVTVNYMGPVAGTLYALAFLVPWGVNLKALYAQRGRFLRGGQPPAPDCRHETPPVGP